MLERDGKRDIDAGREGKEKTLDKDKRKKGVMVTGKGEVENKWQGQGEAGLGG